LAMWDILFGIWSFQYYPALSCELFGNSRKVKLTWASE